MKDIVGLGLSPGCSFVTFQLTEFEFILGGVPVFNLPDFRSKDCKKSASFNDGLSPILPPSSCSSPVKSFPFRKVPVVKITFFECINSPFASLTPLAI